MTLISCEWEGGLGSETASTSRIADCGALEADGPTDDRLDRVHGQPALAGGLVAPLVLPRRVL